MSNSDGAFAARATLLRAGQEQALQMAARAMPLPQVLDAIVRTAESLSDGSFLASILLLDEGGRHLVHGAAPSLPDEYNRAIDGVAIGPSVGSCGTAAHYGHAIIVTDIGSDPLWSGFRDLALRHGLRACWSTPFYSAQGSVLGTFALYYREARGATEFDRTMVNELIATASLVVEDAWVREGLRGIDPPPLFAAAASEFAFFTWHPSSDRITWHNARPYTVLGMTITERALTGRRFFSEFLHAEDHQSFAGALALARAPGALFRFEGRMRSEGGGGVCQLRIDGRFHQLPGGTERLFGVARTMPGPA